MRSGDKLRKIWFLKVVAAESGEDVMEVPLDYLPAFDAMAAAEGKLFVTAEDGILVCYGGD